MKHGFEVQFPDGAARVDAENPGTAADLAVFPQAGLKIGRG
jgi:hypothetical protein